jgi:UDP-N-acetylmuramoyl-tripeptide--D-alanyl-D-alanine ligase
MRMTLEEITKALCGECAEDCSAVAVDGVSTDTRGITGGEIFFAIRGPNFDGHDFLNDAVAKGAVAAVVSRIPESRPRIPMIRVDDTVKALGDLARYWRNSTKSKVIGVTGSNGKTTAKEMIRHILSKDRKVSASRKSFNNAIGLPLTILAVQPDDEFLLLELGTNAPGEIANLAAICRPDCAVVLNVSETHLEGLGSLEGIAREKADILRYVRPNGWAAINADNKWTRQMFSVCRCNLVTFGLYGEDATLRAENVQSLGERLTFTVGGSTEFDLPIFGSWNVYNALAATAVCSQFGLSVGEIAARLRDFKLPPMRMQKIVAGGVTFINDAYNANPRSVTLAIDELGRIAPGRKILVLGEMLELGAEAAALHETVAAAACQADADALFAVGEQWQEALALAIGANRPKLSVFQFSTVEEAGDVLADFVREGDTVFMKASRRIGIEKILQRFQGLVGANHNA